MALIMAALECVIHAESPSSGHHPPVGGIIPTKEESSEGGSVGKLQEFDGPMSGGAAAGA